MYCRNKGIRPRVYVIRIVSHLDLRLSASADPCALVLLPLRDTVLLLHGVKIIAGCDYIKGMCSCRCRMQRCRMTVPEHVCLVTRAAAAVSDRLMSATFSAEEKV